MSDEKRYFEEITPKLIAENGVVSLAIRPNQKSQYGTGGLSGKELQQRFDKLATLIISHYNEVAKALSSEDVLEYFKLPDKMTLADFIKKITDDNYDIVSTDPYIGGEAKLSAILQKLYTDAVRLVAFTEINEHAGKKLSLIYATKAALSSETEARKSADANLESRISQEEINRAHAIDSLREILFSGVVNSVSEHNLATDSHPDMRNTLNNLKAIVENFFSEVSDGDQDTIDRLAEIVYYLNENRNLIDELRDDRVAKANIVTLLEDLDEADDTKIASAKLLNDYFAKKKDLDNLLNDEVLAEMLLPYAKEIRLGGALKYFITTYQHPQSDIEGWIGKEDTWTVPPDQSVEGVKQGDMILFRCFNTTSEQYSYVFTTAIETVSGNRIKALSTSVIHSGVANDVIKANSIVKNLDDTNDNKVLAASTGALIKAAIATAISDLDDKIRQEMTKFVTSSVLTSILDDYAKSSELDKYIDSSELAESINDFITSSEVAQAISSAVSGLVKSTELNKILANYALTTDVIDITEEKIAEALESFNPGFNPPGETADAFAEAFLTNGSLGLEYELYEDHAECTSVGDCTYTDIEIGSKVKNLPVTTVAASAFENCAIPIINMTILSGVTSIGAFAFKNCTNLKNITIPNTLTGIGMSAFEWCGLLTEISIPSGVTSIGASAFKNCTNLTTINIPSGVSSIADSTFEGCGALKSMVIPSGVTSIGASAFRKCVTLKSIIIPKSVTSIGRNAFLLCILDTIYYEGTKEEWGFITKESGNDVLKSAQIYYNNMGV